MTKEIKELSYQLISEIQKLIEDIDYFSNDNEIKDFQDNEKYSNEKRLQKQETWYDQMHEKYLNIFQLYENGERMKKNVEKYLKMIDEMTKTYKQKKEIFENNLDCFLMNDMMKTEKEMKGDIFTEEYVKMNYEENILNKEKWRRKQEEERLRKEEEIRKQIEEEEAEKS